MVTIPMKVLDKKVEMEIGIFDGRGVALGMNNIPKC
jgi:hypothetical protein